MTEPPLWRGSSFLLFFGARTTSILGDRVAALVIPLLVLQRTGSAFDAGIVGAAYSLPGITFALAVGALVERRSKRAVMVLSDVAGAILFAVMAALLLANLLPFPLLATLIFLVGVAEIGSVVAGSAIMPLLFRREQLAAVNGYFEAGDAAVTLGGPPLGGALLQLAGAASGLFLNAVSFAVSALLMALIPKECEVRPSGESETAAGRMPRALLAGFTNIMQVPTLRLLQVIYVGLHLYAASIVLIVVALTRDVLHLSGLDTGLVLGGAGAGGLLASVALAPRLGRRGWGPLVAALLICMAIASVALGLARNTVTAFAANFLLDGSAALAFITADTVRQASTPETLLGRVSATVYLLNRSVRTGGVLLIGALIVTIGHRQTLFVLAAAMAAFALLAALSRSARTPLRDLQPE